MTLIIVSNVRKVKLAEIKITQQLLLKQSQVKTQSASRESEMINTIADSENQIPKINWPSIEAAEVKEEKKKRWTSRCPSSIQPIMEGKRCGEIELITT